MRIFRVESALDPAKICNELENLDAIAIRCDAVDSLEEMELANYLAEKAFEKKRNIGRKLKYEFLLWLAGKTDIRSAMKSTAPEEVREFFVVVFSDFEKKAVLERLRAKEDALELKKTGDPLRLERISLSRI